MTKPKYNKVLTVPEPGKIEIAERPYPNVKPGSVLVKTAVAAVCVDDRMYTDHTHEWFDHPLYGVGHEGVGTVVEAPDSVVFKPGDKVLISHGAYCGRCFACLNALSQAHCTGMVGGGPRAGSSTTVPDFFVDGLAPVERKNDSQSGWAAMAEYRLADGVSARSCLRISTSSTPSQRSARSAWHSAHSSSWKYSAGDYLLLVGSGQRQFSLSHVIVGLFRGARVIVAVAPDEFHVETVQAHR